MGFEGPVGGQQNRKRLFWSMVLVVVVVGISGVATKLVTDYLHERDPIYQCIENPASQQFQLSVSITVTENGVPALVPKGIGITNDCTLPVHTLVENMIHVAYSKPYKFTLGHFLYNWKIDLTKYDTKVYVDGKLHTDGSFLDIPLRDKDSIRVEFTSRK